MKLPGLFFLLLIFLVFAIYLTNLVWFHPKEYSKRRRKGMDRYKGWFPFLSDWMLETLFFPEGFGLWWGRILLPFVVALLLFLLWIAAFGVPFELP